jgi:GTP-binding protein HflX
VPLIEVWNKLDLLPLAQADLLNDPAQRRKNCVPVSAFTGAGMDDLRAHISAALAQAKRPEQLTIPFSAGQARAYLHGAGLISDEEITESAWEINVLWRDMDAARFSAQFPAIRAPQALATE